MQTNNDEVRPIDANKFRRFLRNLQRHLFRRGAFTRAFFLSYIVKWLDKQPTLE